MIKRIAFLYFILCFCGLAQAQLPKQDNSFDPYMGRWQGSGSISGVEVLVEEQEWSWLVLLKHL